MDEVVITGLGLSTSIASDVPTLWEKINNVGTVPTDKGSAPLGPSPNDGFQAAKNLASSAAQEALYDSGLWDINAIDGMYPSRIGCTVSVSKPLFQESLPPLRGKVRMGGTPSSPPTSILPREGGGEIVCLPPDVINQLVCRQFGLEGESRNVIAACATGAYAIALGASWIEQGLCDAVLAGSVEPYPHPLIEAGFQRMGVLTRDSAMRPFDRCRSGFVFGEGAGVVVLEARENARSRRARVYASLNGWGLGTDAHSAVAFNSGGQHIAEVIQRAVKRAGLSPQAIEHVNAHGTATRLNDWIETQALIKAFGKNSDKLMISATKGSTGHLLGAAGSVELILTVLALWHQYVPPTRNLLDPDPECPLDYTPLQGHPAAIHHALSLSFGFGGPIGALVISRE